MSSSEEKNLNDAAPGTAPATLPAEQPYLDEHTTEPNSNEPPTVAAPPSQGKWEMPKPKFQQTSGYLPQGYLKNMEASSEGADAAKAEDAGESKPEQANASPPAEQSLTSAAVPAPAPDASPVAVPDIEPQPDLSDQLPPPDPASETIATPSVKRGGARVVMIVLALIGILIFAGLFLGAVYYFFFYQAGDGQF